MNQEQRNIEIVASALKSACAQLTTKTTEAYEQLEKLEMLLDMLRLQQKGKPHDDGDKHN